MVLSLTTFAKTSPTETIPVVDFCITFLELKLSESGFGIEKSIELGRALTETETSRISKSESTPDKPTTGMKE